MYDDSLYTLLLMGVALSLKLVVEEETPFTSEKPPIPLEELTPRKFLFDDFVIHNATLLAPDKVWLAGEILPFGNSACGLYDIFDRGKVLLHVSDDNSSPRR